MAVRRIHDPRAFDPYVAAGSWWEASAPPPRHAFPPLGGSVSCDVAIVGAGFTGLNAGLRLARDHGLDVRILDLGEPGFGASGRNGGFCCIPSTKLSMPDVARRFGLGGARAFFYAQIEAIDSVAETVERLGVNVDLHSRAGELALAHRPRDLEELHDLARFMRENLGVEAAVYPRSALKQLGAEGPGFHGAMVQPYGFALHPLKYLRALGDAAADAGAVIHGHSEVTDIRLGDAGHVLETRGGEVRARHVVIATNAYSSETVPVWLRGRLLPALSGVLVTRPLAPQELANQGFTTDLMAYDTRRLLHYFRLMPDRRFLFGGRGGISASPRALAASRHRLRASFERMFPAWAHVESTHEWSGLVALSARKTPYIGRIGRFPNAWTALAFHGNGLATGSWAGAVLADLVTKLRDETDLPAVFRNPLVRFPLPFLRKQYLRAAYLWYGIKDA